VVNRQRVSVGLEFIANAIWNYMYFIEDSFEGALWLAVMSL
jgi:hypothetical protein